MTQPPQDGYGGPRYRRQRPPPPPVPRQPPPQPPTAGFGYWDSPAQQLPPRPPPQPVLPPQQPPWQPVPPPPPPPPPPYDYEYLFDDTYEEPPPDYGYPPAGPRWAAHSKRKLITLLMGTLIAVLLAGGGVYYMTVSEGGGDTGASAEGGDKPGAAGERPDDGNKGGARNEEAGGGGKNAGGKRFIGTWQSRGGETLTVGREVRSGKSAGNNTVAYNRPGRLSTCPGVGEARKSAGPFRLALKCVNGNVKSALTGDAVRSGDKLTVEWDGGSKDTFQRQSGRNVG